MTACERMDKVREGLLESMLANFPHSDRRPHVVVARPRHEDQSTICVTFVIPGGGAGYNIDDVHRMHVGAVGIAHDHGFADASVVVVS